MIYLYWYLGISAGSMLLWIIYYKFIEEKSNQSSRGMASTFQSTRKGFLSRILNDVLGPALVGLILVPFWPVLFFFEMKSRFFDKGNRSPVEEPEFSVTRNDLQTQLSLQEIEQLEMVLDPLGAAPNVPFGHLNAAWKKFCEGMEPHDSLWSFTAPWTSAWGSRDVRQGYVIVRGEEIGAHFIAVWKDIEEDADQETVSGKKTGGFDIPAWLRKQTD